LGKPISVSLYTGTDAENFRAGKHATSVYPTYYPVGQGQRNLPLALARIRAILSL
jgi:hypothetical protein